MIYPRFELTKEAYLALVLLVVYTKSVSVLGEEARRKRSDVPGSGPDREHRHATRSSLVRQLDAVWFAIDGRRTEVAHTLILRTIAAGLENWAADCDALGEFLDLRRRVPNHPAPQPLPITPNDAFKDKEAPYVDPDPGSYGPGTPNTKDQLLASVAVKLDSVVSLNQDTLASILKGTPAPQQPQVAAAVSEDDIWRLVVNWQSLVSHFFKAALSMYGIELKPHPGVRHPGPGREERHLAKILAWLTKIEADAKNLQRVQNIAPTAPYSGPAGAGSFRDSLVRLEMGYHKVALDLAQIATLLPGHLLSANI